VTFVSFVVKTFVFFVVGMSLAHDIEVPRRDVHADRPAIQDPGLLHAAFHADERAPAGRPSISILGHDEDLSRVVFDFVELIRKERRAIRCADRSVYDDTAVMVASRIRLDIPNASGACGTRRAQGDEHSEEQRP
jgi:hypothetical protein